MRARGISLVLLAIQSLGALTGCTSSILIPAIEAPRLGHGQSTVRTVEGEERTVGPEYTAELIPSEGWVFMRKGEGAEQARAVENFMADDAHAAGWTKLTPIQGPIRAELTERSLYLNGPRDEVAAPRERIAAVRVKQPSPGKTTVLVVSSVAGAAALIAIVYLVAATSSIGGIR